MTKAKRLRWPRARELAKSKGKEVKPLPEAKGTVAALTIKDAISKAKDAEPKSKVADPKDDPPQAKA